MLKVVDGVNPPQQPKADLVGNRIGEHREDFDVFHLRTNIFRIAKVVQLYFVRIF